MANKLNLTENDRLEILRQAVAGVPLTRICERLGYTDWDLWRYRNENTAFDQSLARALDAGVEAQTDKLLTVHEEERDSQRARVISDNIKWIAARRKRSAYGDSVDINVNERVDISGSLLEARKRAALPVCDQTGNDDTQVAEYHEVLPDGTNGSQPSDSEEDGVDPFS